MEMKNVTKGIIMILQTAVKKYVLVYAEMLTRVL